MSRKRRTFTAEQKTKILLEAANELQSENDDLAKKVGRLSVEVDWLKKNLNKYLDLTSKVNLVKNLKCSNKV